MLCERCGKELPNDALICSNCGTPTRSALPSQSSPGYQGYPSQPSANIPPQQGYIPPQQPDFGQPQPGYGYAQPQQVYMPPPQPGYVYVQPQQVYIQQPGYGYAQPVYPPGGVNVTVVNTGTSNSSSSNAVLVEVLLNIFLGLFGVGWLMAGETTTGVVLLICGYLLYWPFFIITSILTLGIGLLCLVPLHIGLLILNPILLNNTVKRKARQAQFVMMQPREMRPQ